jgi:hypothetical protein
VGRKTEALIAHRRFDHALRQAIKVTSALLFQHRLRQQIVRIFTPQYWCNEKRGALQQQKREMATTIQITLTFERQQKGYGVPSSEAGYNKYDRPLQK